MGSLFGGLPMRPGLFAIVLALASATAVAEGATDRRVSGVITAVDSSSMTLAPICAKAPVTGKLGPDTRIFVNGHAGGRADLRVTNNVKAELGLDDIWLSVNVDTR